MTKIPRDLTPEEARLWQAVTERDRRLHKAAARREAPPSGPATRPSLHKYRSAAVPPPEEKLVAGRLRMDARAAGRVKRGQYPVDRVLDLHGMDRKRAHAALTRCLESCYEKGQRCVLVVTGKGRGAAASGGVLKGLLPQWLNEAGLQPRILGFALARPRHGGDGAFYVLIRRRRK